MHRRGDVLSLGDLAASIEQASIGFPRIFTAIDGPGASGKTTLARQLSAVLQNVFVVHVDDFFLPSSCREAQNIEAGALFDLPRLAEQVVRPGAAGEGLRYQIYDWRADRLNLWADVPAEASIVLEGVYCLERRFRSAYTYKIWCDAAPHERLSRGLARDGESARAVWENVWMPAEDRYVSDQAPERTADLVVSSTHNFGGEEFRVVGGQRLR